ncbi:integration host factor subunit alpha [Microvirga zambiensis]|uniref:integration host factor subunit alpha n=1 Tax=Microvirga zambiensis TaxID=1402137 RepID=UPI00191D3108|nr:integration host factor subunit alpha [Microvirga zambiensis]
MARTSVTRVDLAEAVYQQGAVTKDFAADLVGQVLDAICTTLEKGEPVKLSSFGVFTVRTKGKRVGRNPKTNVEVPIAPRRAITFRASPVLKAHVDRAASRSSNSPRDGIRHQEDGQGDPRF